MAYNGRTYGGYRGGAPGTYRNEQQRNYYQYGDPNYVPMTSQDLGYASLLKDFFAPTQAPTAARQDPVAAARYAGMQQYLGNILGKHFGGLQQTAPLQQEGLVQIQNVLGQIGRQGLGEETQRAQSYLDWMRQRDLAHSQAQRGFAGQRQAWEHAASEQGMQQQWNLQQIEDAMRQQQLMSLFSGLGQLGGYAAGRYSGGGQGYGQAMANRGYAGPSNWGGGWV